MKYEHDPRFSDYYFEDGYVLGITESPDVLRFEVEVVLTPTYPQYRPAPPNMQHCYRRGSLVFSAVKNIRWVRCEYACSIDASGEMDMGAIDGFEILEGNQYRLQGEWGEVLVNAGDATVELTGTPDQPGI